MNAVALNPNVAEQSMLLTASDLAKTLTIGLRTLWRYDGAGKLPRGVRIGSTKRWRRDEIARWIEAGCPDRAEWEAHLSERPRRFGELRRP